MLVSQGVIYSTTSRDALEAFKDKPGDFDLVLTDMTMPDMTGDRLAVEILRVRGDIPIIICTGFSARIDKEEAKKIGVKGFLMKPVVRADMAGMLRRVLNESMNKEEARDSWPHKREIISIRNQMKIFSQENLKVKSHRKS